MLDLPFSPGGRGSIWIEAYANHALGRVGLGVLGPAPLLVRRQSRGHIVGDARVIAAIPALQQVERPVYLRGLLVLASALLVTHGVKKASQRASKCWCSNATPFFALEQAYTDVLHPKQN